MQKPGLFGMNGFMVFLFSCLVLFSRAQSDCLILIDADNSQPFHVRIGEQLYSSTGQGHLVIAHLKDSVYRLNFRFPKKNITQVFPVAIRKKDLGFQLRRADSAWILYNWQTRETIRAVKETDSSNILDVGVKREDGFSRLMASVVNDTAVLYNTYAGSWLKASDSQQVAKKVKPSTDSTALAAGASRNNAVNAPVGAPAKNNAGGVAVVVPAAKKKDTAQRRPPAAVVKAPVTLNASATRDSATAVPPVTAVKSPPVIAPPAAASKDSAQAPPPAATAKQLSQVKKLREVSLKISRKMVFLDSDPGVGRDTVTIFIYFETPEQKAVAAAAPAPVMKNGTDTVKVGAAAVKNPPLADTSKASIAKTAPQAKPKTGPGGKKTAGTDTMLNAGKKGQKPAEPACALLASDADLEAARDAILKANSESDKMAAASAAFAQKCFSVSQVRVLAGLFVSDKAKYRLMEAARSHVSDADHYRELVDMLSDRNFQRKFLAMADKHS